jgi:hypothetical protein
MTRIATRLEPADPLFRDAVRLPRSVWLLIPATLLIPVLPSDQRTSDAASGAGTVHP